MPVTFSAAPHAANPVNLTWLPESDYTPAEILATSCPKQHKEVKKLVQYGLSEGHGDGADFDIKLPSLIPQRSGFVSTVVAAYNQHHALVLRPDDIWLAILCQFNFFVNANAELLRASFVAHDGKRDLVISEETHDFGEMARMMADLVEKNVVDPTLREWAMPSFTTTTMHDTTVSAVLLMATLKQYFTYTFNPICCGIPRVTLEGERADWAAILGRLEKLKEYGIETIAWYHLLHPVISRFVAAFDDPKSAQNVDFWQKAVHFESMGSGPDYYSGWINAFNVFSEQGKWLGHRLNMDAGTRKSPDALPAAKFWAKYTKGHVSNELVLDGTPYHQLDTDRVPVGYTAVDVTLLEHGKSTPCALVAGMVGMQVTSSNDSALSSTGKNDVVRPVSGWWMYAKN